MADKLLRVITCKCGYWQRTDTDIGVWTCNRKYLPVGGCVFTSEDHTESWMCPHCEEDVELPTANFTIVGGEDGSV